MRVDAFRENTLSGGAKVNVCARRAFWGDPATAAFEGKQITSPINNIDRVVALLAANKDFIDTFTLTDMRLQESLRTTLYDA
jgi:hypothetical protein